MYDDYEKLYGICKWNDSKYCNITAYLSLEANAALLVLITGIMYNHVYQQ